MRNNTPFKRLKYGMALQYIKAKSSILPRLLSPTFDAIFSAIPFWQRWRTLFLQPINMLAALFTAPSWLFNNRYSVIYVPTRSGSKRCLVYQPPRHNTSPESRSNNDARSNSALGSSKIDLRPLHIDIHGGGFIGGFPEQGARWCTYLSDHTGAVVVSCEYRISPRYVYPVAHDDMDDIVAYLLSNAQLFGADAELLTVGGASVGGSLALSVSQYLHHLSQSPDDASGSERKCRGSEPKAWLGFCAPVDLRLKPEEKPKSPSFPKSDPLSFLLPLFDVYAGTKRAQHLRDARLHPILTDKEELPRRMLFVVAGIDILMHEQLIMAERLKREIEMDGEGERSRRVEVMLVEKGFHGFLELPKAILEKERMEVFERSVGFIREVHRENGWNVDKSD